MLTGRLPFEAESPLELVDMHRRLDAPPVEILRPDAPARLAALAGATLARAPQDRPADGAALAAELGVEPPSTGASTDAATIILPRPPRRHVPARLVIAIAALVLAAAAGTAGALLLTRTSSTTPGTTALRSTHSTQTSSAATPTTQTTTPTTRARQTTSTPLVSTTPLSTTLPPLPTTTVPPPTTVQTTATIPNPGG